MPKAVLPTTLKGWATGVTTGAGSINNCSVLSSGAVPPACDLSL